MTSVRTVLVVGGGTQVVRWQRCWAAPTWPLRSWSVSRTSPRTDPASRCKVQRCARAAFGRGVGRPSPLWLRVQLAGAAIRGRPPACGDPRCSHGGPDLPATLGAYRPKLAELLAEAAIGSGAKVRLGATVETITQDDDGIDVTSPTVIPGGTTCSWSDGIRSRTRKQIGIDVEPQSLGMGIWRVHAKRPDDVVRTDLSYNGPCYIAGYCPTGPDILYAYLVEDARAQAPEPDEKVAAMRELAAAYHGPWDAIREDITDADRINYALFEHLLIEGPWNRGRAIVIGDAAHACPPTSRSAPHGAGRSAVLAEVLLAHDELNQDVFDEFVQRRILRAQTVRGGFRPAGHMAARAQARRGRPRLDGPRQRPGQPTGVMPGCGPDAGTVGWPARSPSSPVRAGDRGALQLCDSLARVPPSSAAISRSTGLSRLSTSSVKPAARWTVHRRSTSPTRPLYAHGSTTP